MNQITNLQVDNSKLKESVRIYEEKIDSQKDRLKKLEWYYLQAKSKKYRNCGSQANLIGKQTSFNRTVSKNASPINILDDASKDISP